MSKLKLLVQGWSQIPHSYSIVNFFQLVHLYKNFKNELVLYRLESDYYNPIWNDKKKYRELYSQEYIDIYDKIPIYNHEQIDIIYNITYPYDITLPPPNVKKVVFYTSEFGSLNNNYFKGIENGDLLQSLCHSNLHFVSPSEWSNRGMEMLNKASTSEVRAIASTVITHGVDTSIFKKLKNTRENIRKYYNVSETDILLCNIGAMTRNKGITIILQVLNHLVFILNKKHFKLLLKGTGDLYNTREFLNIYIKELRLPDSLFEHIIFTDSTLSFEAMNGIYNAIDLYISPYIAEGFNLIPLEVLASGTRVLLPITGSTVDYTRKINLHMHDAPILYINSKVVELNSPELPNGIQNQIDINNLVCVLLENEHKLHVPISMDCYNTLHSFIETDLSWNKVSVDLFNYLHSL